MGWHLWLVVIANMRVLGPRGREAGTHSQAASAGTTGIQSPRCYSRVLLCAMGIWGHPHLVCASHFSLRGALWRAPVPEIS
ncbi:hypothetical protein FA13DRAFT_934785 [Coprinellus micaceus]|uniref:Secreted protein n=1 Tax=Coprinellus micaceus TaxID=71717 RepID=A0A4Y7SZW5_COPMI|nr:hypothetical protein FA13DRAFT_934785 [Coprinellus micaceus]